MSHSDSLRRARPLLGTLVEISVAQGGARTAVALDAAFAAVAEVHGLMSFHEPSSDVAVLNRRALHAPVRVHRATWQVIARAQAIAEASDGLFDITVAPLLVAWGFLPAARGVRHARFAHRGHRAIRLLAGNRVRFLAPAAIDLGGIAKGYAVDAACAALEAHGIRDYVVNAGGDLRVGARSETIHVRAPWNPGALLAVGQMTSGAVATSADYHASRQFRARNRHPLVSTRHRGAARLPGSVSVFAADCMTADALTKVACTAPDRAPGILQRFGAEAIVITGSGLRHVLPAPAAGAA